MLTLIFFFSCFDLEGDMSVLFNEYSTLARGYALSATSDLSFQKSSFRKGYSIWKCRTSEKTLYSSFKRLNVCGYYANAVQ